jgi:hypothetical protein
MSGGGRARHKQARRDGRGRNIASVARSIAIAIEQLADVDDTIARLTAQPVGGEEDGQIGRRGKERGEEGRIQPQARRTRSPQRQTLELRVRPFTRPGTWSAEVGQRPRIGPDRLSILQRSNWLRSLSAMASIISHRSASCCGVSRMIATFQESSWGTTEMASSVGHSQMSSISSLMAASSSSRVFAGFFKRRPLSGSQSVTSLSASACLGRSSSTMTPPRSAKVHSFDAHFLITGLAAAGSGAAGEIANVTQAVYPSARFSAAKSL